MTPKHKTAREEKIAYTLRLLDSDKAGEVVAAVHALKRLLQSLGTDFDGLASGFEKTLRSNGNGAITQPEVNKTIADAYARTPRTNSTAQTIFTAPTASRPGRRCAVLPAQQAPARSEAS